MPNGGERLAAEPDVLLDGEVGDQRQFLEDGARRRRAAPRSDWRRDRARRAAGSRPASAAERAGEDLDEGALAGAVLAEERMHLAGAGGEVGMPLRATMPPKRLLKPPMPGSGPCERRSRYGAALAVEPPGRRREEGYEPAASSAVISTQSGVIGSVRPGRLVREGVLADLDLLHDGVGIELGLERRRWSTRKSPSTRMAVGGLRLAVEDVDRELDRLGREIGRVGAENALRPVRSAAQVVAETL